MQYAFAQKHETMYSVAFYNVENLFDTVDNPLKKDEEFTPVGAFKYTGKIYRAKLRNIARVLADMGKETDADGVDIVGLAEIENDRVLKDLVSQMAIKQRNYKYIWFESPDMRGINTAMLYNPQCFRLLSSKPVQVKLPGDPTRYVLFVSGVLAGDTVHLLVNHWPSRREGKDKTEPDRHAAAMVNKHIVDSLLQKNIHAKILVMGDFNDNPDDKSILNVLAATGDKEHLKTGQLFNPWLNIYKSGTGSLRYKKHWDMFDQVMMSSAFLTKGRLKFHKAEIFKKDYLFTKTGNFKGYPHRSFGGTWWLNGYSDHLPVILYLSNTNK